MVPIRYGHTKGERQQRERETGRGRERTRERERERENERECGCVHTLDSARKRQRMVATMSVPKPVTSSNGELRHRAKRPLRAIYPLCPVHLLMGHPSTVCSTQGRQVRGKRSQRQRGQGRAGGRTARLEWAIVDRSCSSTCDRGPHYKGPCGDTMYLLGYTQVAREDAAVTH